MHSEYGNKIVQWDVMDQPWPIPDSVVQCCVTSPPYWGLRNYEVHGQIGLERTPEEHVEKLVAVFREVRRVLRDDGTLWLNYGDCYYNGDKAGYGNNRGRNMGNVAANFAGAPNRQPQTGFKDKDLVGMPWRVAFALQGDGWWLRQDIVWHKPNPMPEPVKDRCTRAHEFVFLLSKSKRYYFDAEAISEPQSHPQDSTPRKFFGKNGGKMQKLGKRTASGEEWTPSGRRNKRDVWTIPPKPFAPAHFATFPPDLVKTCLKAGTKKGDLVLDPFMGSGTTAVVARQLSCDYVGLEISAEYIGMAEKRLAQGVLF